MNLKKSFKEFLIITEHSSLVHEEAYFYYRKVYSIISILNIFILSFSTIIKLISELMLIGVAINIITTVTLFISTFITGLLHFLEYEKIAEIHLTCSKAYKSLYLTIKQNLELDKCNEKTYIWVNSKINELVLSSPIIPDFLTKISKYKNFDNDIITDKIDILETDIKKNDIELQEVSIETINTVKRNNSDNNLSETNRNYEIERYIRNMSI